MTSEAKTIIKLSKENIKTNRENLAESTIVVLVNHNCGCDYGEIVSCTKFHNIYGPIYYGDIPIDQFSGWADMIKKGSVTEQEKRIIIIMSANEGKLDSIQSYDSEALTAGAMQKTITSSGNGQFPALVAEFRDGEPDLYNSLFRDCGWTVEGNGVNNSTMYYADKEVTGGEKITGEDLKDTIRDPVKFNINSYNRKKKQKSKPIASILKALKNEKFMQYQIIDFTKQLRKVLNISISDGNSTNKLSTYFQSELGRATALDQYVNRPAYVAADIKNAVHEYITKHPNIKANPTTWGENHAKHESAILEIYGNKRRGVDMPSRFKKLKSR